LRVIAAMYGKKYCTFVPLGDTEVRRRDMFYFPAGAAFCNEQKVSGPAAASIMIRNPSAVLPDFCMKKGVRYLKERQKALCNVQQPEGFTDGLPPMALSTASSSTKRKEDEPPVKKRPAGSR
jgi:hypothetical protein